VSRHQTASTSSQQQRRPDAGTRLKPARPASLVAGEAEGGPERSVLLYVSTGPQPKRSPRPRSRDVATGRRNVSMPT